MFQPMILPDGETPSPTGKVTRITIRWNNIPSLSLFFPSFRKFYLVAEKSEYSSERGIFSVLALDIWFIVVCT
jgi:hypothetical protein